MTTLVIGGAGYVGGHLCAALEDANEDYVVYDNLSTGFEANMLDAELVVGDIRDTLFLRKVMVDHKIDRVFHFAAKAYVGDSVKDPATYYDINVGGSLSVLKAMLLADVGKIVFSSTCAVYGIPATSPISETETPNPINPYGYTKLTVERMLSDMADAHGIKFAALRYFNAAGADRKGRIGERHDPEPHLIPNVIRAAQGKQDAVQIFGQDYPTPDGTAVRDFIHVDDLAEFHLRAMAHVDRSNSNITANLGTGTGYSVRQIVDAVSEIAGTTTPAVDQPRRPGDPPALVASPERAQELLVYSARHSDLPTILRTAWDWHERE